MDSAGLKQKLVNPREGGVSSKSFWSKKVEIFVDKVLNTVFFRFFVINLQTLILDGGNQLNLTVFLEEHGIKFEKNFRDK